MKTIAETRLADIEPLSISTDPQVKAASEAIDRELTEVTGSISECLIMPRLEELDEKIIDLLAWQYHVDFYELAETLQTKRDLVRESLSWHMKKGTKYAIIRALNLLGIDAEYQNWYEYGGEAYHFRLKTTVKKDYYLHGDKDKITENIRRAVEDSKAARSYLDSLETRINVLDNQDFNIGIGHGTTGRYEIALAQAEPPEPSGVNYGIASGVSGHSKINIFGAEVLHENGLKVSVQPVIMRGSVVIRSED